MASSVPDIRLIQNRQFPNYNVTIDWQLLDDGTLDDRQALVSAVAVALGTNALADLQDVLPDPDSTNREGWWGDFDAGAIWDGAWPIGSKLWLLRRAKITPQESVEGATEVRVQDYINAALRPLIDLKICTAFDVWTSRVDKQRIDALVRIYRGPLTAIELLYQILWDEVVRDQP
jgi:phage gp46-like protein